jgi:hypothetical protein
VDAVRKRNIYQKKVMKHLPRPPTALPEGGLIINNTDVWKTKYSKALAEVQDKPAAQSQDFGKCLFDCRQFAGF